MNLNQIDTEDTGGKTSEVPAGNYKMRLVGSKQNPYRETDTDIDFQIVEGQYARKHIFASLPSPAKGDWVAKAAAVLVKRIGATQLPGEDLVDTLSRAAANGPGLITADVTDNFYTDKNTGETKQGRPRLAFFSIASAV